MGKQRGKLKATSRKARRLVREFDQAARNDAWTGSGEPEEDAKLRPDYLRKKSALLKFIAKLESVTGIQDFHHAE